MCENIAQLQKNIDGAKKSGKRFEQEYWERELEEVLEIRNRRY